MSLTGIISAISQIYKVLSWIFRAVNWLSESLGGKPKDPPIDGKGRCDCSPDEKPDEPKNPDATSSWEKLIEEYKSYEDAYPQLKIASLSQWIVESGRGNSALAKEHFNFGGLKWRDEMQGFATPVRYLAHDGWDTYCKFSSEEAFINGYWRFIARPPYKGWENYKELPYSYIMHLKRAGYAEDPNYFSKVGKLFGEASELLGIKLIDRGSGNKPKEGENPFPLPTIKKFIPSPKKSSRNGTKITGITNHYTVSSTAQSAINTLTRPLSQGGREASAHFVIDKNGDIYQLVNVEEKAWHAPFSPNASTIGIEHVAMPGERITEAQERASVALQKHYAWEYGLSYQDIDAHRWDGRGQSTSCPGSLYGKEGDRDAFLAWRRKHFKQEFPQRISRTVANSFSRTIARAKEAL